MRWIESKISKKYFLIALVVILVTLSLVYGFTMKIMNDSFHDQIRYRDELISRSLAKRIDFILKMVVNDMRVAGIHSLEMRRDSNDTYVEEVRRMLARQPLYLFIQSVSAEGWPLSRIPEPRHLEDILLPEIIERLRWSKTHFISNLLRLADGTETFVVAYPVLDETGAFRGGVMAFVDLKVLSGFLSESLIGQEGLVSLLDREGTVIAHNREVMIGQSLAGHELGRLLKMERFGLWQGALFEQKMLVAYRPLLPGTFGLIVGESMHQAWAPSNHIMQILFQGFLVILLVATGLTLWGTSRVVKPIRALIRQTNEYKENKRKGFDPIHTGDEIEDLSLTMDKMAKDLTERERRLFYILESIPYAVITIDQQGIITTFNKSAEQLTGLDRSEVIGRLIIDVPFKASREEFIALKTLKEGKDFDEVDSYILDKNRHRHDVKMHSALYEGEDKRPQGAIIVFRDVSEVKKLEEYLRKSEQLASLGQLTAGIAHEIKNPLSIIQAAAEGIQLELDDLDGAALAQGFTEDILNTSDRMNGLINDFLSLAFTPEKAHFQRVNLASVVNELLHLLKKKFHDQNIELRRDYATQEAFVSGHKNGLTQVFLNIFLNSLHSMEQGGVLHVRLHAEGEDWQLAIADTGPGISKAKLQRIFNPFFSTKSDGTGLGLAIAHEIITEHQGEIWAESVEGQGTALYVKIPRS